MSRQRELQKDLFKRCKPLPGSEEILQNLSVSHTTMDPRRRALSPGGDRKRVSLALCTSSHKGNFEIKTENLKEMFTVFSQDCRVLGDDPRIPKGRGKPLPDIWLLALKCINEDLLAQDENEREITPEECLVFEDSVPGVESGRRAGMRVVWIPHPGLLDVYKDRVDEVLAGRTGEHDEADLAHQDSTPLEGSPGKVGEINDGWAEKLSSLAEFDYRKYGIDYEDQRYRSESGMFALPGTTDKELEEMTAKADGKLHAPEEGTPVVEVSVPVFEIPEMSALSRNPTLI